MEKIIYVANSVTREIIAVNEKAAELGVRNASTKQRLKLLVTKFFGRQIMYHESEERKVECCPQLEEKACNDYNRYNFSYAAL